MAERSRGGAKKAEAGVQESVKTAAVGVGGAGQNEGMKKTPLFALALEVTPVGVDAQVPDLEETRVLAEQGHAGAQSDLGVMYSNGRGVPEDDAEAVRWYRLAAEQGYANAQTNLGNMYVNGEGVPRDMVLAYMWFDIAAAQGHEGAQRNRGLVRGLITREQIAEAQRLSTEWLEAHPLGGN